MFECAWIVYTVKSNTKMMSVIVSGEPKMHTFCTAGICMNCIHRKAISTVVWFYWRIKSSAANVIFIKCFVSAKQTEL